MSEPLYGIPTLSSRLRIGDNILEVASWGHMLLDGVWTRGSLLHEHATFSGYPLLYTQDNEKKHSFVVNLDERHNITMTTFKDFVNIHIHAQDLENSAGLMGDYKTGASVGRDRSTHTEVSSLHGQAF